MNRRQFLAGTGAVVASSLIQSRSATAQTTAPAAVARVTVDPHKTLGRIPADFTGLGYEISSVAEAGLLSGKNAALVQLVRTLGPAGVIRIGGDTGVPIVVGEPTSAAAQAFRAAAEQLAAQIAVLALKPQSKAIPLTQVR